jgi:hypothetical protein
LLVWWNVVDAHADLFFAGEAEPQRASAAIGQGKASGVEFIEVLFVWSGAVTGELVDAEVFIEVFEVVFLDPAVEHETHDFPDRALGVVGEDGELDGLSVRVGGSNDNLADGGVFVPGAVDVFEVVRPMVAGVVALAAEGGVASTLAAHARPANLA